MSTMTIRVLDRANRMAELGCDVNNCGYECDTQIILLENGQTRIITAFAQKNVQAVAKTLSARWDASAKSWMVSRRLTETEIAAVNAAHNVSLCNRTKTVSGNRNEWPAKMTPAMVRAAQSGATYADFIDGSAN